MTDGKILLIDKPKGMTSFDVIRDLRKKLGVKKMGHAGTLDPAATGLMIIAVGATTKELEKYVGLPKTYVMDILLGVKTDSGDLDGEIVETIHELSLPNVDMVKQVLKELIGEIELQVPIYSAIKVRGKKLYEYARKGEEVDVPTRVFKIFDLKLLAIKDNILQVQMECAKGTYARAIGEEIGRRLGYPATLSDLRRTKIGEYKVNDAQKLSDF